jgi:uncharacterized protein YecE (DUF72 family)
VAGAVCRTITCTDRRIYYSAYSAEHLAAIAEVLTKDAASGVETWCIFDNTAAFAATGNALTTRSLVIAADRSPS